jgi:hypothetical protein
MEPPVRDMVDGVALYERVWRHNGGNARFGRRQRALLHHAGFRHGETVLRGNEVAPDEADFIAELLVSPRIADVAVELGWADRPTLERYAEGVQTWTKHPDALCIMTVLQTVGWRD